MIGLILLNIKPINMKEKTYKINNLKQTNLFEKFKSGEELQQLMNDSEVQKIIFEVQEKYLPWEEFRLKDWATTEKEKIWGLVKLQRGFTNVKTIISDESGSGFVFNPRSHLHFLHKIDLELGGSFMGVDNFNEGDKRQFIRRNLIEESIASSQLEGANTSRKAAKKMLEEGKKPKDKGEQMIVNNHETMKLIEEELKNKELSLDILKELHQKITFNTIEPEHQGVLRETLDQNGNPLVIKPWDDFTIAYTTPAKEFVEKELEKLIAFANDKNDSQFIHPLIKAIMLHFWIGLLHPFEDGNGRLARIIFYWYMLRNGYWAFSYLSISERILKSQKQYAMAFIYSEQDDNDLGYFIHYNISKLELARKHFEDYIKRTIAENRQISHRIKKGYNFNHRQLHLLQCMVKNEQEYTSFSIHSNVNAGISRATAISDLRKLVEKGFLKKTRTGKNIYYYPTNEIKTIFEYR